jgi:hypothetical protein
MKAQKKPQKQLWICAIELHAHAARRPHFPGRE